MYNLCFHYDTLKCVVKIVSHMVSNIRCTCKETPPGDTVQNNVHIVSFETLPSIK